MKLSLRLKEDWFQLAGVVFSSLLTCSFWRSGLTFGVATSAAFVGACVYIHIRVMSDRWCRQCELLKMPLYVELNQSRTTFLYKCGKCEKVTDANIVIGDMIKDVRYLTALITATASPFRLCLNCKAANFGGVVDL